jgi:hypothetical protein
VCKPDQGQKVRTVSQFDRAALDGSFLTHAGPAGIGIAGPGKFALIWPHFPVGVYVAQLMYDAAFKDRARCFPQTIVDANNAVIRLGGVVEQVAFRAPGDLERQAAEVRKRPPDQRTQNPAEPLISIEIADGLSGHAYSYYTRLFGSRRITK